MLDALSRALRPRKPNPLEAWKAPRLPGDQQGQVHFYVYDRGQCFDKGEEAILAMVNLNGCAAHYMTKRSSQVWTFVALPHLSTEKRCCERMGYRNLAHMHEHLFRLFDTYLTNIGWKGGQGVGHGMGQPDAALMGRVMARPGTAPTQGFAGQDVGSALRCS